MTKISRESPLASFKRMISKNDCADQLRRQTEQSMSFERLLTMPPLRLKTGKVKLIDRGLVLTEPVWTLISDIADSILYSTSNSEYDLFSNRLFSWLRIKQQDVDPTVINALELELRNLYKKCREANNKFLAPLARDREKTNILFRTLFQSCGI